MRTIGLIGGTSWYSTIEYYKLINQMAAKKIGDHANPSLVIFSINIELMRRQNKEEINAKYLEVARKIQETGAEAIVICANTPHMVYEFVQPKIDIPILHIADATGQEAEKKGLKHLGLLGNKPTMTGQFISGRLNEKFNISTVLPSAENLDKSHHFVSKELTQGIFSEEAKRFFMEEIEKFQAKGVDGIILGCTELPLLIEQDDVGIPTLATTFLHAQMATDFIFS